MFSIAVYTSYLYSIKQWNNAKSDKHNTHVNKGFTQLKMSASAAMIL